MTLHQTRLPSGDEVLYVGPHLDEGPSKALFYFALSGEDSLVRDPFNQPVQFLEGSPIRIFSMTLPAHEDKLPPENAMNVWAERMKEGKQVLPPFIEKAAECVRVLEETFLGGTCGVAGLSRGAFIASHVAAHCPQVTHILGFAPLTRLTHNKEFIGEEAESLALIRLCPKLFDRKIRFYIGNHDTRVGTHNAFELIEALAQEAHQKRIRSSPIELIIGPSIGYQGHGTSPEVFKAGAEWIKQELLT